MAARQNELMQAMAGFGLATLLGVVSACALAQDAHLLQQRASFAYGEMRQAERDAERAQAEAKEQSAVAIRLREQADEAAKQSAQSQNRASEARARAAEARSRWQAASDELDKLRPEPAATK
jgi:hypothetical protein